MGRNRKNNQQSTEGLNSKAVVIHPDVNHTITLPAPTFEELAVLHGEQVAENMIYQQRLKDDPAFAASEKEETAEAYRELAESIDDINASPDLAADMAIDGAGNLYIARTHQVLKIDTQGTKTVFAGTGEPGYSGDNSLAVSAQLNAPCSIAARPDGTVFVLDAGNHVIRKIKGGVITTHARLD